MVKDGYEITPYREEHKQGAISVLSHLWGPDTDRNSAYFGWKYEANPNVDDVLGIVATSKGKVVGFRGYFAARVQVGNGVHTILRPGDTCVDPSQRRSGLSVAMGQLAMAEYSSVAPLFINFSCTKPSLPGYLRMGFVPLTTKFYQSRTTLFGLIRYIAATKSRSEVKSRVVHGKSNAVELSPSADPVALAPIASAFAEKNPGIQLVRDEAFFEWRFACPVNSYLVATATGPQSPRAYVIFGLSPNQRRAYIVDYSETEEGGVANVLHEVVKARFFDVVSILDSTVDQPIKPGLKKLGFSRRSVVRLIEGRLNGELPILIRPVPEQFTDEAFFLGGLDTRQPSSWALHAIASDAA